MQTFKKILYLLTPQELRTAGLLLIMIIIMAILEMIGVASILPFVTVLANPSIIETNFVLNRMFQASSIFGVENNQQFLFSLGVLVFILLVTSLIFKGITTYVQIRFVQILQYNLSKRLIERYLSQSYSWYLTRNSAEFIKASVCMNSFLAYCMQRSGSTIYQKVKIQYSPTYNYCSH